MMMMQMPHKPAFKVRSFRKRGAFQNAPFKMFVDTIYLPRAAATFAELLAVQQCVQICDWNLGEVETLLLGMLQTPTVAFCLRQVQVTSEQLLNMDFTTCPTTRQRVECIKDSLRLSGVESILKPATDSIDELLKCSLLSGVVQHEYKWVVQEDLHQLRATVHNNAQVQKAMEQEMVAELGFVTPRCSEYCSNCLDLFKATTAFDLEITEPKDHTTINYFRRWVHDAKHVVQYAHGENAHEAARRVVRWMEIAIKHGAYPAVRAHNGPWWG